MKNVIHIYGASGSGTSTLGRKISEELGYKFMDTDDYYWLPTNPQYTTKRSKEERLALMKKDISENDNVVISGSLVDWGDELIPLFTLVIRLVTDTKIRIERLKNREKQRFGNRIMPAGDMYANHIEFIEWAREYDTGSIDMRSKANHDEWQKLLLCKQIVLDGAEDLEENFKKVQAEINSMIDKTVTATVDFM
ncbi:MAG: AAA family ATPase [Lachnospiraceae bacterium]|nr:AAA family ATPase [Lachnospiraceae bacterium]